MKKTIFLLCVTALWIENIGAVPVDSKDDDKKAIQVENRPEISASPENSPGEPAGTEDKFIFPPLVNWPIFGIVVTPPPRSSTTPRAPPPPIIYVPPPGQNTASVAGSVQVLQAPPASASATVSKG